MPFLNFNGKILDENSPLVEGASRGLRYGDGVFETMLYADHSLVCTDEHYPRLWKGLQTLKFQLPAHFSPEMLESQTQNLIEKNKLKRARVRWTFFRGNGGLYDPEDLKPRYILQTLPLAPGPYNLNSNGLRICLYKEARKSIDLFANLKHNNALPYVMGALYAKSQQCNDALIFNTENRICESTISNLFLIHKDTIITPPLTEGCVAGTRRAWLLSACKSLACQLEEKPVTFDMLLAADALFLTNAIQPIRWVSHLEDLKIYPAEPVRTLFSQLKQTSPRVFC